METIHLPDEIKPVMENGVPAEVVSCSADGVPNTTIISQVYYVDREHVALGGALAEIGVADSELRVPAVRALRVAVDELPEVLARGEPVLVVQFGGAALEQELVRIRRAGRRPLRGAGAAGTAGGA